MAALFLSHSHVDKDFARTLAQELIKRGISTWIDKSEMQAGDQMWPKVASAIRDCDNFAVVLSPTSITSGWVLREINYALALEATDDTRRFIPILYQACDIPEDIRDRAYADFTADHNRGLEELVDSLHHDLLDERYRRKRALNLLSSSYQDWLSFGRRNSELLTIDKITVVVANLSEMLLSAELVEYIFLSIALNRLAPKLRGETLQGWIQSISTEEVRVLFGNLLRNESRTAWHGMLEIVDLLQGVPSRDIVVSDLIDTLVESRDTEFAASLLRFLTRNQVPIPEAVGLPLVASCDDWRIHAEVFRNLKQSRKKCPQNCLVISDGSSFSNGLASIARNAGFSVGILPPEEVWQYDTEDFDLLHAYNLIVVVRGEHYGSVLTRDLFTDLKQFVVQGGILLATPWSCWETAGDPQLMDMWPFEYTGSTRTYIENKLVQYRSTRAIEQVAQLGSAYISYEPLSAKPDSFVELEMATGIPLLGYRRPQGAQGCCYYLNACQHYCGGHMQSPLEADHMLHDYLVQFFSMLGTNR